MKKIVSLLYMAVILAMAAATVFEKTLGSSYVYGEWWFTLLWTLLVAFGIAYIVQQHMKRWHLVMLHLSFVVILTGALLTHLTSWKGAIKLREGQTTTQYLQTDDGMAQMKYKSLPVRIRLDKFQIDYNEGSDAARDYMSCITIIDGNEKISGKVSMNNILTHHGIRFYQSSFDEDGKGSVLQVSSDPWGIPVTYTGYALLFLSMIWLLINPKGTFRQLLKSPLVRNGAVMVAVFLYATQANATTVLPKNVASDVCKLYILHNNRVCQMQTMAIDFTRKIHGSGSYKGCSPEQIMTGFMFWGNEWNQEKIIKVKGSAIQEHLHLDKFVSLNQLLNQRNYILADLIEEYYQQNMHDKLHKEAAALDEKVQLIVELRMANTLRMFPLTSNGRTSWYAPFQMEYPETVNKADSIYMQSSYASLNRLAQTADNNGLLLTVKKIIAQQSKNAGKSLPSALQTRAERMYNAVPVTKILFMMNLTLGFITLFFFIREKNNNAYWKAAFVIMSITFLALSTTLALRWIISGNIPMANGYETMLTAAWITMLVSILMYNRMRITLVFGFLMSGFFLLVSHIGQMDPAIGPIMPVLNSPLLSIHVSIIMMSYALLSMTFICGIVGLLSSQNCKPLMILSQIFLYPAIVAMAFGIFIGAIWANISWGTYWNWDPKETWALITFMIYAMALHTNSLPLFRKPRFYHAFVILAFMSIIMTYFGVNYILGGMHSYA